MGGWAVCEATQSQCVAVLGSSWRDGLRGMRRRVAAAGAIPGRERCATHLRTGLAGVVNEWRSDGGSGSALLSAPVCGCHLALVALTLSSVWLAL